MQRLLIIACLLLSVQAYSQLTQNGGLIAFNKNNQQFLMGHYTLGLEDDVRLMVRNSNEVGVADKTGILVELNTLGENGVVSSTTNEYAKTFVGVNNYLNTNDETFVVYANGHVYATEITVQLSPFPDYVFAEDYELMPLNELRQYIASNKHLPNMPAAEQVEEGGLGLGELSRLNTEKIEELTLYLLQLEERMSELENENAHLKKELEAK